MADDTAATGSGVSIAIEDPTSEDASELIRQLSAGLAVRYDFADDGSGLFGRGAAAKQRDELRRAVTFLWRFRQP